MGKVSSWVSLAAQLAPSLHGQTALEQRERVAVFAEQCGLLPDTMRRMVRAWNFAMTRVRSENMHIADVNGAFIAVEALERLSRKSPETAARICRAVLTGECGYRDVVKITRDLTGEPQLGARDIDWDQFLWTVFQTIYGNAPGSYVFNPSKDGYSDLAKRLRIDIEFEIEDHPRAVFLSPSFPFSEGSKRPIEDHLARAFMSLAFYVNSAFIIIDHSEERSVKYFTDRCSKNFRKRELRRFGLFHYNPEDTKISMISLFD